MYSTIAAKQFNQATSKYLSGGIVKDAVLTGVKFETSPTGKKFIEISFAKDGQTVSKTEWEPQRRQMDTDETFATKERNLAGRLSCYIDCFYDSTTPGIEFEGSSYTELANWFITLMNKVDMTKKLNIKVVYNKDGYPTLPDYYKYAFVEPAEKPETWTKEPLAIRGIDQITRPVVADTVKTTSNPFQQATATSAPIQGATTIASDLPFEAEQLGSPLPFQ